MNKNISELLDREVSRREFLQFLGGSVIVLFGLSNFISYLTQFKSAPAPAEAKKASHGFGTSRFGD